MKAKKTQKIFNFILIIIMIFFLISPVVNATTQPSDIKEVVVDTKDLQQAGNNIVRILQTFGVILSVIILIIIGIKYMLGSAEEKAEYKKTLMPYVIGAALIFAASTFAQVAYDFFHGWKV